jgi:hypothetical protein
MRPSLLHPLTERHPRRRRPKRQAEHRARRLPTLAHGSEAESSSSAQEPRDIAVERVRAAGGPLDRASYTCECGYLFAAPVSTTVVCPHCSAEQAW